MERDNTNPNIKPRQRSDLEPFLIAHGWAAEWAHGVPTDQFEGWRKLGADGVMRRVVLHRQEGKPDRLLYAGDATDAGVAAIIEEANVFADTGR
jgi:hypothetical protein